MFAQVIHSMHAGGLWRLLLNEFIFLCTGYESATK